MKKFNLTLNKDFKYEELTEGLRGKDINLRFHDSDFMPDFAIVEVKSEEVLQSINFISEYEESGVGYLLGRRPELDTSMLIKTVPKPNIECKDLKDVGLYGLGVGIAVIDSGYNEEYCGKIEEAENFSSGPNALAHDGHGNIVISIIKKYAGMAKIYSAKVCQEGNKIDEESVHRALKWIRGIEGIKLINMSIGFERNCVGSCNLSRAINKMVDLGYIIFAAIGNDGEKAARCPACAEKIVAVGGLDPEGNKVASFSNKGHINGFNKPDLLTSAHGFTYSQGVPNPYWGTSFAAPILTGIVGACYPKFISGNIKQTLIDCCTQLVDQPFSKQGNGKFELEKLLEVLHQ
ncbi:hypothetical protein COI95_16125 [Bacillus cereus]|nr:hypothetical protein COI95_16125 [Bacillus cereus]